MKNYILILISAVLVSFFSCKKKEILESKIVKVPTIALIGNPVFSTSVSSSGGSYTDPGAKITDETASDFTVLSVPTENDIDFTTPGLYSAKYVYKTKYGYELTATRLVLVTSVSDTIDLSGIYGRSLANGTVVQATVTKVGTGLYKTDNVGGVGGRPEYVYDVYFGFPNDTTLIMPTQYNPLGGELYGDNEKYTSSPTGFQWVVVGSGYTNAVRQFVKQ